MVRAPRAGPDPLGALEYGAHNIRCVAFDGRFTAALHSPSASARGDSAVSNAIRNGA
jgi:hypothetical protein